MQTTQRHVLGVLPLFQLALQFAFTAAFLLEIEKPAKIHRSKDGQFCNVLYSIILSRYWFPVR